MSHSPISFSWFIQINRLQFLQLFTRAALFLSMGHGRDHWVIAKERPNYSFRINQEDMFAFSRTSKSRYRSSPLQFLDFMLVFSFPAVRPRESQQKTYQQARLLHSSTRALVFLANCTCWVLLLEVVCLGTITTITFLVFLHGELHSTFFDMGTPHHNLGVLSLLAPQALQIADQHHLQLYASLVLVMLLGSFHLLMEQGHNRPSEDESRRRKALVQSSLKRTPKPWRRLRRC
jgi:hypothetical protein